MKSDELEFDDDYHEGESHLSFTTSAGLETCWEDWSQALGRMYFEEEGRRSSSLRQNQNMLSLFPSFLLASLFLSEATPGLETWPINETPSSYDETTPVTPPKHDDYDAPDLDDSEDGPTEPSAQKDKTKIKTGGKVPSTIARPPSTVIPGIPDGPTSPETDPDPTKTTYCTVPFKGKKLVQYALMIDAGSTGSRIHVYKFNYCSVSPMLEYEVFMQVRPGLSSFKDSPAFAAGSLNPLMDEAVRVVPESLRKCTPLAVKATAGLRMLGVEQSDAILKEVEHHLKGDFPFPLVSKDAVVIMDGKDEGELESFSPSLSFLPSSTELTPSRPSHPLRSLRLDHRQLPPQQDRRRIHLNRYPRRHGSRRSFNPNRLRTYLHQRHRAHRRRSQVRAHLRRTRVRSLSALLPRLRTHAGSSIRPQPRRLRLVFQQGVDDLGDDGRDDQDRQPVSWSWKEQASHPGSSWSNQGQRHDGWGDRRMGIVQEGRRACYGEGRVSSFSSPSLLSFPLPLALTNRSSLFLSAPVSAKSSPARSTESTNPPSSTPSPKEPSSPSPTSTIESVPSSPSRNPKPLPSTSTSSRDSLRPFVLERTCGGRCTPTTLRR